jgi:sterol desaturase/sphingolipid hydroxylase (fatty acid hydroxylase superfamily)
MSALLLAHEPLVRAACFAGVFAVMGAWEILAPRRGVELPRRLRWTGNFGLLALDTVVVRLVFPVLAVGIALLAAERGFGLLNLVQTPAWFAFLVSMAALDLAIYLQHRALHAVPGLWRLHRVHHADLAIDVTTGLRFHPLEMILSTAFKLGVVAALGAPAVAVLTFEIVLNATSMFNHGNVRMPPRLDRVLRWLVVTPDMHRIHHSVRAEETHSNFGFNLSLWDRLFGTWRACPQDGHDTMTIGIEQFRGRGELRIDRMLLQPFRGAADAPSVARGKHA